mgnify:CR=1 FL=1|jgi:WD40 repeat protein
MAAKGERFRSELRIALTIRVSSVEFSQDSSILAVGSAESCIRLWSLKNEKLRAKKLG